MIKDLFVSLMKAILAFVLAWTWQKPKALVLGAFYWMKAQIDGALSWCGLVWAGLKTWIRLKLQ